MWRKRSKPPALILLALVSALVSSCDRKLERSITLAQCESGALLIHEQVFEQHGFEGVQTSVTRSLNFHAADGRRVPIDVSDLPSYRLPSEDRLAVLREPRPGDWQVYVDPATIDPRGYCELIHCLQVAAGESSPRQAFAPVPAIATLRYTSIEKLRKRYVCAQDASLVVREDGLVYFQSDSRVLVGFIHGGSTLALDGNTLRYLSSRHSRAIADPLSYFQRCKDSSAASMFDEFDVRVTPGDSWWSMLARGGR